MGKFNGLVVENNKFTEKEVDFVASLGKMLFLKKELIPEYEQIVIVKETGAIVDGAILDDNGKILGGVDDLDSVSVTRRPVEATHVATNLFFQSFGLGKQVEVLVSPEIANKIDEDKDYRKSFTLVNPHSNFWTNTRRSVGQNGQVRFTTSTGLKFHAEGVTLINAPQSGGQPKTENKPEQNK